MTKHHSELHDQFSQISSTYLQAEKLISDSLQTNLQVFVNEFKDKIDQIVANEKTLKIGIVGEVKAGKSSFLNALLFEGRKVLPEAPTPMTAALTKIGYSQQLKAEVFFYNRKDWETIEELSLQYDVEYERLAREYKEQKKGRSASNPFAQFRLKDVTETKEVEVSEEEIRFYVQERISEEKIGCKELTDLVIKNGIDLDAYLDQTEEISGVETIEDLVGRLNYYVGSDGILTPIVKSTNIYLDLPTLKDLEIIDTPGTNDPIVSRGLVTRKYLAQCDAIFLLSYAGQFMKSQDVEFIVNTLPTEGIRKGIIVGSKFDSALLNTKPGGDLRQELMLLRKKLHNYANYVIEEELKKNPGNITLQSLKEYLPPQFVSSVAYSIAVKDGQNLNELEEHILDRLQFTFRDLEYDRNLFMQLSNVERIKNKEFQSIISQKNEILEFKLKDTITGQKQKFKQILQSIESEVISRLDNLTNYDKKQLEDKHNMIISKLKDANSKVELLFEKEAIEVTKKIQRLQQDLREAQDSYANVDVSSDSRETYSHTKGVLFWKKDVYKNVTYHYAKVNQVIDNISKYTVDIQRHVMDVFNDIVDSQRLRKELKNAILSLFDLKDGRFNESEILNPIEILLNKLTISEFQMDTNKYELMLSNAFTTSVVENQEIHQLVRKQKEVLSAIIKDTVHLLDKEKEKVSSTLTKESKQFTNNVAASIADVLNDLQSQLSDRESYIHAYQDLIDSLKKDIKQIN
ncbi:dynamin family protein [Cytobacillus massiliigabonensis]|uniref:dynamin family protein n=1 Tax=Cytobacillus massiliigabonensis TaxID=1871011 RepID=UPI000C836696|nr:dynamin family protein [Cytobacillus massiliigabonensis]